MPSAVSRLATAYSVLFIVDPLERLKAYKDTSIAMMRELTARGHEVWAATPAELAYVEGRVMARAQRLALAADDDDWYTIEAELTRALPSFSAVLMRKDPPFDVEYLASTWMLELAQQQGARVFNDPRALRDHNEKFAVTEFPDLTVPTVVTRDADVLREFWERHGDIVVKPLDGMGGRGIFRVRRDDPNVNVILETVGENGARSIMAQRFIPEIRDGDKRVLIIAGEVVPYTLARVPKPGESRGNLAAGGIGHAQPLTAADRRIAAAIGPILWARGLLLVGIDVIGDYLTEINVTSPTCFVEISQQTGFDVAAAFVDALERVVSQPRAEIAAAHG
ncbi:MAG TPA: glutathione synthase [Burkholderiaceae bacterium]|nr:glutathione synthase [Burkholderiaceae bacterium]